MSNAVFPTLPGLAWDVKKTPIFATKVQKATSGRELRVGYYSYPLWKFALTYTLLRADAHQELQQLMGFFVARQGQLDSFLYSDPSDNTVSSQAFGSGDGSTTSFQLLRSLGGFAMPVYDLNGAPTIYVGGVAQASSSYSISATGLVTFNTAPASGAALTWDGQFYYRCRFLADTAEFNNFMYQLWELQSLEFQSIKP